MPRDTLRGLRFPLPENWEVEDTTCVTFVIPDDPEYLATLTGLIDDLKWSKNFDRDSTGTGAATVARTWQRALESQPILTEACDMPEFRVNADCSLEVNCGTDEVPDWQPVFTGDHPEGGAQVPFPPDTPEYEADTARCIAAANISAQLKYGTETLATDAAIVGGIAVAIIDLLGAFLFFVPGGVLVDIAIAIINLAVGHVAADFSDDLPDIDWVSVRDSLACFLERDGSMTETDRAAFLSWMDGQYAGNLAWALSKIIVQNVSADGLTTDARMPQNDISIEDCPNCDDVLIIVTYDEGGYAYTEMQGTVGAGGNPDNCTRSAIVFDTGSWYNWSSTRIEFSGHVVLHSVSADNYRDTYLAADNIGVDVYLYDDTDTIVSNTVNRWNANAAWNNDVLLSGVDWDMPVGYYIRVDIAKGWPEGRDVQLNNTDLRLDNIAIRYTEVV